MEFVKDIMFTADDVLYKSPLLLLQLICDKVCTNLLYYYYSSLVTKCGNGTVHLLSPVMTLV